MPKRPRQGQWTKVIVWIDVATLDGVKAAAKQDGYAYYSEWIRNVLRAAIQGPRRPVESVPPPPPAGER